MQEIRRAVEQFRDAGKLTVAWAETFGEFSAGNVPYYLATAFETIYLQPSGDLGLTGIAMERYFLRGTLDQLGVDFQVAKRHEYKNAAEQLTERSFSGPAREATERMAVSVTGQLTDAIAERRRLAPERGQGADRPRPVPGRAGPPDRPRGRARLPGRGVRAGPQARRPGRDPAVPGPLPARRARSAERARKPARPAASGTSR